MAFRAVHRMPNPRRTGSENTHATAATAGHKEIVKRRTTPVARLARTMV
jgi:hypothetical protein